MTTICYRDGVLAADTAVFDRGCYCGEATKIAKAADGTVGGGAGALGSVSKMITWLNAGAEGNPPEIPQGDDSEYIWIRPDKSVWWLGPGACPTELRGDFMAIGSGFRIAMGAFHMGATALRAVEICADLDDMTRRPILTLEVGS